MSEGGAAESLRASELEDCRQAMIDAVAKAEKACRAYAEAIERARIEVENKTAFLLRELMSQKPKGVKQ